MEFALYRHKFIYSLAMEASWVFIPSGLLLLDDVSGCTPFDKPGSGGFC